MKDFIRILMFISLISPIHSQDISLRKIDTYIKEYKEKTPIPGMSIVIVKDDKIIFAKGYGLEVLGDDKAMTENSSSGIGSLTKSLTALAVMQLVEKGKINLSDPVIKYAPSFKLTPKELSDRITVQMLLSNSSGIPAVDDWTINLDTSENASKNLLKSLSNYKIQRTPGQSFEYSNEGWVVLGLIIENVTGMKYEKYIQKNIFEPLKMDRSTTDGRLFNRIGVLYGHDAGIESAVARTDNLESFSPAFIAAGSSTRCSAENLGHYLIMLLNGGEYKGIRLITRSSIDQMWKPAINMPGLSYDLGGDGEDSHYGYGWMITKVDGRDYIEHMGSCMAMSSQTMIDIKNKIGISILFNITPYDKYKYPTSTNFTLNLFNILLDRPLTAYGKPRVNDPNLKAKFIEMPREQKNKYLGIYTTDNGNSLKVSINKENKLVAMYRAGNSKMYYEFLFMNKASIVAKNIIGTYSGQYLFNPDGDVIGLTITGQNFKKKTRIVEEKFKAVFSKDKKLNLIVPKKSDIEWVNNSFKITDVNYYIIGGYQSSFKDILTYCQSRSKIVEQSDELSFSQGSYLWKQKTYRIENNEYNQNIILWTEHNNMLFYISIFANRTGMSKTIQEVLNPIVESIDLN